jgi:hypothetical protein
MDLYFQGTAGTNRGETPEYAAQAKELFAGALALDPSNIEALVGGAFVDSVVGTHMFGTDLAARLSTAEAAATRALSLAPNHAWAHMILGNVQIFTNRPCKGSPNASPSDACRSTEFNSRRGFCADHAARMTTLARSSRLGSLPASAQRSCQ